MVSTSYIQLWHGEIGHLVQHWNLFGHRMANMLLEKEKRSIRPTFSAERVHGGTLLAMCSNDFVCFYDWAECRFIRRIDVNVKNLYWADSGDLVAIASDTSFYILKFNRDLVSTYLDSGRPVDEEGVEDAFELLYEINERVRTGLWILMGNIPAFSVARFLESRGMVEDALEVATDPDYRFDLAIQLGKLEVAKEIATGSESESKWKQLGELAMSTGMLEMAEDCLKNAMDLSGLLLLYSSLGDAEGILKLSSLAKENGKNNVAFLGLFMLGKLEECLQLLIDSNRIPEAALMARSYLPSKVPEIVTIWRKDLNKVNPKAAESLANPEEYPNLFEDWQIALAVESKVTETRGFYPSAVDYVKYADRSHNLVEEFRNMQMDEDTPLENGDLNHEVEEENGEEGPGVVHEEAENVGQEEAVEVDADSTDGVIVVNGNEADEEWGTNTEGNPSA
ncbi:hypothetical protein U1Q18_006639 [Sarracenia purpurea var. burkii]